MIYNLIRTVKHVADKRIQNLSNSYTSEQLVDMLNGDQHEAVRNIAKAIEHRSELIGRSIAIDIVGDWSSKLRNEFIIMSYLQEKGLKTDQDMRLAKKVSKLYGDKTEKIIKENPYELVKFFPFKKVDTWGKQLMPIENDRRILGAIDEVIKKELLNGNTTLKEQLFFQKIKTLTKINNFINVYNIGFRNKRILMKEDKIHFFGAYSLEQKLTKQIQEMLNRPKVASRETVEQILLKYDAFQNHSLSDEQREAVISATTNKFHCIVGYAGTGKSTVLNAITYVYKGLGKRIEMAALSGKAALKMTQSSGKPSKTIYRFLKQVKEGIELTKNGESIQEGFSKITNQTVIILDEASMIDLGSMANIFRYLKPGTQILLLGDNFQLPPISFGLVFHLLVKNECLTSKLTRVFRQKDNNPIPTIGKQIREGFTPFLPHYEGISVGVQFFETDGEVNAEEINKICVDLGGFNALESNLQIISATNRNVDKINSFIHKTHVGKISKINKAPIIKGLLSNSFAIGDTVVFNKNNYQKNLYNGMIGYVSNTALINKSLNTLQLTFDELTVKLKGQVEISNVSLAYSLTCHKLQGSQSRNVIIVLEDSNLIEPTWLYTAITRATHQVVIVGSKYQYKNIFSRIPSYQKRTTGDMKIEFGRED